MSSNEIQWEILACLRLVNKGYWQCCQGSCVSSGLEGAVINSEKTGMIMKHSWGVSDVTLGWLCLWIDCREIAHDFIFLIEHRCDLIHPTGNARSQQSREKGINWAKVMGKGSMYLLYWECRGKKWEERKCSSSLWLQGWKIDAICVMPLSSDSQSWFPCQTRIAVSFFFYSTAANIKWVSVAASRGRWTVVYALLLPGTARRACYLGYMCDLLQEIHPVMTTDYVFVWDVEIHPW